MPNAISPSVAFENFKSRGLLPLEDFPGARFRWKSKCLACQRVVTPFYSSVVNKNNGGCNYCGQIQAQKAKRVTDYKKASNLLSSHGMELLSSYEGVKAKAILSCKSCKRIHKTTIDSLRRKICTCKKVPKPPNNPLSTANLNLSLEWHPFRNGLLTPDLVSAGARIKAWWQCSQLHEWEAAVGSRNSGRGCPVCAGQKIVSGINDLETCFPQLAAEWHPQLNFGVEPIIVSPGSNLHFWWICPKNPHHEWSAMPIKRTRGTGCPFCARDKFKKGVNDLSSARPDLLDDWDYERNEKKPDEFPVYSKDDAWWSGDCGHEWQQSIANRVRGFGCTVCASKAVVVGVNDLVSQSPLVSKYFHPDLNSRPADSYTFASGAKVWWFCDFGHEYESVVASKTTKGTGCPVCSNQLLQPGVNDLMSTDGELFEYWDQTKNGELSPDRIRKSSRVNAWWLCKKGHSFESTIKAMHEGKCTFCSGHAVLRGETDLETLNPQLSSEWSLELNDRLPSDVTPGSDYSAWWTDKEGHTWNQKVQVRSRGVGCPECSKGGYSSIRPGILYFISKASVGSYKIGITNQFTKQDRLNEFVKQGWKVERTWEDNNGRVIQKVETRLLRWIRKDLGFPPFLSFIDMPRTGGWSETLSQEAVSKRTMFSTAERFLELTRKEL
jgi:hypothetical protein